MATPKVWKGVGIVRMRRLGVPGAKWFDLGDVESLKISNSSSQMSWKNHRTLGGGNLHTIDKLDSVKLDVGMQEWTQANREMCLQGKTVQVPSETVTGEAMTLAPGSFAKTEFPGATSVVITRVSDSQPIALAAVTVSAAGIAVPADSTVINEDTPVTVDYVSTASTRLEPMVEAGAEYEVLFDGLNEAVGGQPELVEVWRWKAPPADELALIDDGNPGKLLSKGEILASRRPAGESPFWRATTVGASA